MFVARNRLFKIFKWNIVCYAIFRNKTCRFSDIVDPSDTEIKYYKRFQMLESREYVWMVMGFIKIT